MVYKYNQFVIYENFEDDKGVPNLIYADFKNIFELRYNEQSVQKLASKLGLTSSVELMSLRPIASDDDLDRNLRRILEKRK
jgi:hypothetical protein